MLSGIKEPEQNKIPLGPLVPGVRLCVVSAVARTRAKRLKVAATVVKRLRGPGKCELSHGKIG